MSRSLKAAGVEVRSSSRTSTSTRNPRPTPGHPHSTLKSPIRWPTASRPTPRSLRTARSRRRPSIAPSPTPPRPWSPPATSSRSAAVPPGCRTGRSASRTPVPPRSCGPSRPGATHPQASAAPARRSWRISEACFLIGGGWGSRLGTPPPHCLVVNCGDASCLPMAALRLFCCRF